MRWARSSVGQSVRLITGRSQVRTLSGPPLFLENNRPSASRVAAGAIIIGDVAQLGERGLCKPEVVGSIPIVSTMYMTPRAWSRGFLLDVHPGCLHCGCPFRMFFRYGAMGCLQRELTASQKPRMPGGKRSAAPYGVTAAKQAATPLVARVMLRWPLGIRAFGGRT